LGQYLFGSVYNTQYHNPPSFNVTYPVNGQFKVITGSSIGTSPMINIYIDGAELLNQAATINTTYSVNVAAGAHIIKVDNLGTDWTTISNYTFTNIGSPVTAYVLKSADTYKAAGWLLNSKYNWQYLQSNGAPPPAISGSNLSITGMHNGNYTISFYSTVTGDLLSTSALGVTTGTLNIPLPDIAWDMAFKAVENSALPVRAYTFTGNRRQNKNYLYINIADANNIKEIFLERSPDGMNFKSLSAVSASWNSIAGKHEYIDKAPLKGLNFYRLKYVDKDGSVSYSQIIKLANDLVKFSVYPNPVDDNIILDIDEGIYFTRIIDQSGRIVSGKSLTVTGNSNVRIPVGKLAHGIYYISVLNDRGDEIGQEKIIR
jgi:Secretion system C-terminal sorting domain